jgi:hypothetical protein
VVKKKRIGFDYLAIPKNYGFWVKTWLNRGKTFFPSKKLHSKIEGFW